MTTWVLLRGLTRESRHWGEFPTLLQAQLGSAQVLTLDLPGNGQLHGQQSPTRVVDMAAHCRAALRERGLPPPYHLLAMSLGAMVALAWAHAQPSELQGCVLINTSLRTFSPWYQRLRPSNYGRLLGMALTRDAAANEQTVLEMTTRHPTVDKCTLLDGWARWRLENPVSRDNALRQLWAAARFRTPRAAPRVPLLVLASAADGLVDPRCSQRLAQAWGAAVRTHPTAGHDLPLDDGVWVAREVAAWLAASDQAPRKCFL
ncbi:MAG: alpha/beta hydrolase [Burkholderiaceae bacterium]